MRQILILLCLLVCISANADIITNAADSCALLPTQAPIKGRTVNPYRFNWKQLIVPVALIAGASAVVSSDWMESQNDEIREELQEHNPSKLRADDFLQYAPIAGIYALELCGVKGVNSYVDKTIILGTATIITVAIVNTLKATVSITRPDGSKTNSFPSGHTATAFMGAELLRREYQSNIWIGIGGYSVATLTAFLRMYNNRHWLTDVIAGAGFGILSAEAAYWLYPIITKTFFKKAYSKNIYVAPSIGDGQYALSASLTF